MPRLSTTSCQIASPIGIENRTNGTAAPTPWISPSCTSVSSNSAFAPSCTVLKEPLRLKVSAHANARISNRGSARANVGMLKPIS